MDRQACERVGGAGVRGRPIVDGREQRWQWWIMRIDLERQVFVYFHDVERFSEAVLFVDVAISMVTSDFVVWCTRERRVVHDSRDVRRKLEALAR